MLVNYRDKYTEMHGQQNVKGVYFVMANILFYSSFAPLSFFLTHKYL